MPTALHLQKLLHEPEGLACFVKTRRAVFGHVQAVLRDDEKLLFTRGIRTRLRLPIGEFGVTVRIMNRRVARNDDRLQKTALLRIVALTGAAGFQFVLRTRADALKADRQNPVVMNGHVTDSVIKVIPGREDVVLHCQKRLRLHIGRSQLAVGFPLPIGVCLFQLRLGLFGNIERVRRALGDRVELGFQPLVRIFGERLTAARFGRRTADDEFFLPDDDGDVFQNMLERLCPADDRGQAFRRAVRLRQKPGAVGFNFGQFCKRPFDDTRNAVGFFDKRLFIKIHLTPSFSAGKKDIFRR